MRRFILLCALTTACAKPEPVQDPLDYLRIGVDPRQEADSIIAGLRASGFQVGRRIDEAGYVAFDAARGPDSTVRVITARGPALSVEIPDVRKPESLWVELGPEPRPDFDRDGQRDLLLAIREPGRTCLAWAQVDASGFVSEVFRAQEDWGDFPCVIEVDPTWPRLLLEVTVPDAPSPDARVRFPVRAGARAWALDDSPAASARWEREIESRKRAIEEAEAKGDAILAERQRAELAWLERLRKTMTPAAEPN